MPLNSSDILEEIRVFIPDENVLTDPKMIAIIDYVIAEVGDDDSNEAEVKCKSLQAIGYANLARSTTTSAGIKREKVGDTEKEWFDGNGAKRAWSNFLDSLTYICPIFGYTGLSSNKGIKITPGDAPVINPECCPDDLGF